MPRSTRRVLVEPRADQITTSDPGILRWARGPLRQWMTEVFDQLRYIFGSNPQWTDTHWEFNGNGQPDSSIEVWRDDGVLQANIQVTGYIPPDGGGTFHVRGARGNRQAPATCSASDIIGGIGGRWCYDTATGAFHTSSPVSLHWQVTEAQTTTAWGSWLRVLTTPKASVTRREVGGFTDNQTIWSHDTATFDATSAAQTLPHQDARFVASAGTNTGSSYVAVGYGTGVTPGFRGMHARGTPASRSATQADDMLAFLAGHAYDGSAWPTGSKALIAFHAAENQTGSAQGTYITFQTTPNASTTRSERLRLTDDGRLYGTALHNNAGAVTGATNQYVASGTYTPTLTNVANLDASTAYACQWMRVGNVVTVSGKVDVDPTAAASTQLGISLPIASALANAEDCAGTGFASGIAGQGAAILADATNDRAQMQWIAVDLTNQAMFFTFTYEVL